MPLIADRSGDIDGFAVASDRQNVKMLPVGRHKASDSLRTGVGFAASRARRRAKAEAADGHDWA